MIRNCDWWWAAVFLLAIGQVSVGQELELMAPETAPAQGAADAEEDMDVLARGPVHEAYAEQASPNPEPGVIAPQAPPDPIDEVPPDWKPEGEDVTWIPGYWFWDGDLDNYVWVSGVWRRVPPDRQWVPGYWQATESGYQWIAGFWRPTAVTELNYAEVPPESLETGPSSPAPSEDYFWIPGNWELSVDVGSYRWRPGYWHPYRQNWMWVGSRYVWTPRGCIYVPGYWDYTLSRRGFLFAPVYFRSPIYLHAGFHYRPSFWIGSDSLLLHLFVAPRYHHLYFGDYYAPLYRERHYIPCYDYHRHHRGFASLYVYYQHHYRRQGIDYCQRVHDWHRHYATHADRRPPHTFHMHDRPGGPPSGPHAIPTNHIVHRFSPEQSDGRHRMGGQSLEHVMNPKRELLRTETDHLRSLASERRQFEAGRKPPHPDGAQRGQPPTARHDTFRLPQAPGQVRGPRTPGDSQLSRSPGDRPGRPPESSRAEDSPRFRVPLAKDAPRDGRPPNASNTADNQLRRTLPHDGAQRPGSQRPGIPPDRAGAPRLPGHPAAGDFRTPLTQRGGQPGQSGAGPSAPGNRAERPRLPGNPAAGDFRAPLTQRGGQPGQSGAGPSAPGNRAERPRLPGHPAAGDFRTPLTHRGGQPGIGSNAPGRSPQGPGAANRVNRIELPPLSHRAPGAQSGATGAAPRIAPPGGGARRGPMTPGGAPLHRPPTVRGQSPSVRAPASRAPVNMKPPAAAARSPRSDAGRQFAAPPTARGAARPSAGPGPQRSFTPPPRTSVKGGGSPASGRVPQASGAGPRPGPGPGSRSSSGRGPSGGGARGGSGARGGK